MLPRKVFGKKKIHRMENILHHRVKLWRDNLECKRIIRLDDSNIQNTQQYILSAFHNGVLDRMFVINKLCEQWKVTCFSKEKEIQISVLSK